MLNFRNLLAFRLLLLHGLPKNPNPMKHWRTFTWKDYLRVGAGMFMFVLGLVGLVLPILQGVLFLIISAVLLAPYSDKVQGWLDATERRYPELHRRLHQFKEKYLTRGNNAE